MTKNEARKVIEIAHWRTFADHCDGFTSFSPLDKAYIALREPPSIAQSIRNTAINWPQFLGDVECEIIDSFVGLYERANWRPNSVLFTESTNTARTFMLLVAEALE